LRFKTKYAHIAKDGFSDLMRSYANGRTHVELCLRLEKELYRLWIDVEGKKVETKDFAITHIGLEDGINEFNKKLIDLKTEHSMAPVIDMFVVLEKKRLDEMKVRADKQTARKPMKRTENNKQKLKNLINKMGLTKEEVINLLNE